jgi:hypothetical protein
LRLRTSGFHSPPKVFCCSSDRSGSTDYSAVYTAAQLSAGECTTYTRRCANMGLNDVPYRSERVRSFDACDTRQQRRRARSTEDPGHRAHTPHLLRDPVAHPCTLRSTPSPHRRPRTPTHSIPSNSSSNSANPSSRTRTRTPIPCAACARAAPPPLIAPNTDPFATRALVQGEGVGRQECSAHAMGESSACPVFFSGRFSSSRFYFL